MINLAGAFLVVSASSILGYLASRNLSERCRLLKLWFWILEIFKSEIGFQMRLLPEILQRIAGMMPQTEIAHAFTELAETIAYGAGVDFSAAWQSFMAGRVWQTLRPSERQLLLELGCFLGNTGREDQLAKLSCCKAQLERVYQEAEAEQRKQTGLYRYLGFAAGATLVLWLG